MPRVACILSIAVDIVCRSTGASIRQPSVLSPSPAWRPRPPRLYNVLPTLSAFLCRPRARCVCARWLCHLLKTCCGFVDDASLCGHVPRCVEDVVGRGGRKCIASEANVLGLHYTARAVAAGEVEGQELEEGHEMV